jgi:type IV pilus assembly protein PilQ
MMKYKGLNFLRVTAFVIAACVIAAAQSGNKDFNGVSTAVTAPDMNSTVDKDLNDVPATVATPDMNSTVDKDLKDVPATVATPDMNSAVDKDLKDVPATVATPDMNSAVDKDLKDVPATVATPDTNSTVSDVAVQEDVLVPLEQRMLRTISVDFRNTPIEDAIRMIAEQADVDIITSPSVTGNVTATLTNVPLTEALDNILAVHGYGRLIDKNMIRISPLDEIAKKEEVLDSRVYQITYADVKEVEGALKKFISKRGSISSNPGTSNIIVKDSESNIKAIDAFIEKIDRVTPQVLVEVRIYDVTSTDGFDISADWTFGRNNPVTTISDTRTITTNNLTRTVTADGSVTTELTSTGWQDNTAGGAATSYNYRKSKPFVGGDFSETAGGTIRLGLLDTVSLELELSILRSEVGAKLLANPRILVLDNETAEFEIVREIPYTEVSTTGNTATQTVKFKNVGVDLQVTPHVTRDGMIRLNITPEFSVQVGTTTPPTVDSRKVNTRALVKDGQTVVLGGLRKREVSQEINKIALLGDIPILGGLFSDVEESVSTNEIIIFITPRIITEPTLSANESKGLEATEFGDPRMTYTGDEKAEQRAGK